MSNLRMTLERVGLLVRSDAAEGAATHRLTQNWVTASRSLASEHNGALTQDQLEEMIQELLLASEGLAMSGE